MILDKAFTHLRAEDGIFFLEDDDGNFYRAATRRSRQMTGDYFHSRKLLNVVAKQGMATLVHDVRKTNVFPTPRVWSCGAFAASLPRRFNIMTHEPA